MENVPMRVSVEEGALGAREGEGGGRGDRAAAAGRARREGERRARVGRSFRRAFSLWNRRET